MASLWHANTSSMPFPPITWSADAPNATHPPAAASSWNSNVPSDISNHWANIVQVVLEQPSGKANVPYNTQEQGQCSHMPQVWPHKLSSAVTNLVACCWWKPTCDLRTDSAIYVCMAVCNVIRSYIIICPSNKYMSCDIRNSIVMFPAWWAVLQTCIPTTCPVGPTGGSGETPSVRATWAAEACLEVWLCIDKLILGPPVYTVNENINLHRKIVTYCNKLQECKTKKSQSCKQELISERPKHAVPLISPKARRRKAGSFKFLSSIKLSARTLRLKLQKMRPSLKDELISSNPVWSWE